MSNNITPVCFVSPVANRKNVSWLLGRDGDVSVMVIGEVDELKTSKLICSGPVERKAPPSLHNSTRYGHVSNASSDVYLQFCGVVIVHIKLSRRLVLGVCHFLSFLF